ncbi:MAG: DUF2975 domain-containing protein [Pseudomonadales bacterium]
MPNPLSLPLPAGAVLCRVSAIARWMQWLTLCCGVMTLAGLIAFWLWLPDAALDRNLRGFLAGPSADGQLMVSMPYRLAGLAITGAAEALLIGCLMEARKLFAAFAGGVVFTTETALRLRRVALMVTAFSVAVPLTKTLLAMSLASTAAKGPYMVVIVTFGDFVLGLLGGLLLAIAWAMVEAARIAQENESFV